MWKDVHLRLWYSNNPGRRTGALQLVGQEIFPWGWHWREVPKMGGVASSYLIMSYANEMKWCSILASWMDVVSSPENLHWDFLPKHITEDCCFSMLKQCNTKFNVCALSCRSFIYAILTSSLKISRSNGERFWYKDWSQQLFSHDIVWKCLTF